MTLFHKYCQFLQHVFFFFFFPPHLWAILISFYSNNANKYLLEIVRLQEFAVIQQVSQMSHKPPVAQDNAVFEAKEKTKPNTACQGLYQVFHRHFLPPIHSSVTVQGLAAISQTQWNTFNCCQLHLARMTGALYPYPHPKYTEAIL